MKSFEGLKAEFQSEGAVLVSNCLASEDFCAIDTILQQEWEQYYPCKSPFDVECASFAQGNTTAVSEIYVRVANLEKCVDLARNTKIRDVIFQLLGEQAKIYGKIPFRIDVPLETKELAVWHQDDYYVKGAPHEVTAWIPLQDTPMHVGALSVIKGSHHLEQIPHTIKWGKKYMPVGVYDAPVNIVEMKRGDVLFFDSYLLHTSNMNFSDIIRYSLQIRFTSKTLGEPSTIMGNLYDF